MPSDPVTFALHTPGHLGFPSTLKLAANVNRRIVRVETSPTGHMVFYRPDWRRFLATDPDGHPLHECEWGTNAKGEASLLRARVRLDSAQWVGLKSNGLINQIKLNLATRTAWQRITPDDLRAMAARALRVPIEEVRWFFNDEDLSIDAAGMATIRHRKDALYLLEGDGFEHPQFMACMGAMHWDHIDFLPVVELFKSLLPGTGSAVFELIRGLYDDQNKNAPAPQVLRYRGLPTYPSEAAFRLFSSFFDPVAPHGEDALSCYLDPLRAHELVWRPGANPPVRYCDERHGLCLTVRAGVVQKATLSGDPAGVSYGGPTGRPGIQLDRSLRVAGNQLVLRDREKETVFDLDIAVTPSSANSVPISPVDWRSVWGADFPQVHPKEAYGATLLYPEDDREIGELSAQPFVADYLQDWGEQDDELKQLLREAKRILIDNGDAVIATCVALDRSRDHLVSVRRVAFAQRQAQQLWALAADSQQWEGLRHVRFVQAALCEESVATKEPYDLVYQWMPYEWFDETALLEKRIACLHRSLRSGGTAFVVGPSGLDDLLIRYDMEVYRRELVETLPTFSMHRTILPKARVKSGLTLFRIKRR